MENNNTALTGVKMMIADFVLDGNIYAQVTSITCDGNIETTHNEHSNIELIEPIPLTPEILEKNGFILKTDGWLWCKEKGIDDKNYIFIQFRKGCDEVRLLELNFVNKVLAKYEQIHYVHELQHALRLCNVNKEIIL